MMLVSVAMVGDICYIVLQTLLCHTLYIIVNTSCAQGQVRLMDGRVANEGRVELCSGGVWVGIYDTGWDYNDAKVVCKHLGYPYQCKLYV